MPDSSVVILPRPQVPPTIEMPQERRVAGGVPAPVLPQATGPADFAPDSEISIDLGSVKLAVGDEDFDIGAPAIHGERDPEDFFRNLAAGLPDGILGTIAEEIYSGVDADDRSRAEWVAQYQAGLDLINPKVQDGAEGQRRNISRINDSTLMKAMVKYWAAAEAEMLPAAGPAKVSTIGSVSQEEEARAQAFEADFNYYLTEVATEYYPDTARALMHQSYAGLIYKKIFRCPMRRRPVSESVLATDLIISEQATDLDSALRVTHRIDIPRPIMKRMMAVGHYRDIDLGLPTMGSGLTDGLRRAVARLDGSMMVGFGSRPQDAPYEVWECDTFLDVDDIAGSYEYEAPDGMPLPYKVAVDRSSRQVIGLWRNWRPDDELYLKRNMFVRFGLVPSLGYSDWGFLQLLGNQTKGIRAALRLLIDAGMFANFPGGFKAKNARAASNTLAPEPGEFVDLDIPAGADLSKLVMRFPYEGPNAVFVQLIQALKQDAEELGGTVQIEVGEGRSNVPAGTILAMVEQQVQVMAGIHKGNHRAQKQEFRLLRELIAEDPAAFALMVRARPRDPAIPMLTWQKAEEFTDLNLVPQSDPNVPSFIHRLLVANVLMLIAQQAPNDVDTQAVIRNAISTLGADPRTYVISPDQKPPVPPPPPDPRVVAATIKAQSEQQQSITQAQEGQEKNELAREKLAIDAAKAAAQNETARQVESTKQAGQIAQLHHAAALNPPDTGI